MSNAELELRILEAERARLDAVDEAAELLKSLRLFVGPAWKVLKPAEQFKPNWHIDAICEKLEAVTAGEIKFLQVWVPRGTMKSMSV